MRHLHFTFVFILLCLFASAQQGNLIFTGHNTANNEPLLNTSITVFEGSKQIQAVNTANSSDFKLTIPFGKNYRVYFENKRTQRMFMEVKMDNVPEKKSSDVMKYDLTIPFFPLDSKRIDSTQFRNAFHKIVFDGKNRMVDDTIYMNAFLKKVFIIIKEEDEPVAAKPVNSVKWSNLAGKFTYDTKEKTIVINKKVNLLNSKGEIIKTTNTNKFGTFIFTGVNLNEATKIEVDFNKEFTNQQVSIILSNTKNEFVCNTNVNNNKAACQNTEQTRIIEKLIDPRFTYKIAAKLTIEKGKKSDFFSGKTVFLLNDRNTIIKRTKTNIFGSFVFSDVKPGMTYLIGVDKTEIAADSKINLYNTKDNFIAPVDSNVPMRFVRRFNADNNYFFNELLIDESQLRMDVSGKLYGDNVSNPLGDIKIMLLNDKFETIDTTTTDNFGKFIFRYIKYDPNYSIAYNDKEQLLEAINNIMVYDSQDEVIKIVSNIKGKRFKYKPLSSEQSKLTDIYAEDPWLELLSGKTMRKGETEIIVENIFFENNKYDLLTDATTTLDKVAMVLLKNPNMKLELSAHTDANGNDAYNQTLSEQRAKAANDYIVLKGVEAVRISSKGYGESKILNKCKNGVFCPDDEHHENRRIEFKLLQN